MTDVVTWIAIVDDDASVTKALGRLLRARGLVAKTFKSGQDFLAVLPSGLPACLIVDLHMPGMSGFELQQHLRDNGIPIPTIVITGHGEDGARERCERAGAIAFLLKPLQDASLFAAIHEAKAIGSGAGVDAQSWPTQS